MPHYTVCKQGKDLEKFKARHGVAATKG